MSQHQNIFLIGMPGAGKSTVGKALAKLLGLPFVDSDEEIVSRNGVGIATIFEIEGEAGFRQRESAIIAELTRQAGIVMATGGGAILNGDNRNALVSRGLIVYLKADLDVLVQRTSQNAGKRKKRPLLENTDVRKRLADLLAVREPLYNEIADITVNANQTNRSKFLQELADEIARVTATGNDLAAAKNTTHNSVKKA